MRKQESFKTCARVKRSTWTILLQHISKYSLRLLKLYLNYSWTGLWTWLLFRIRQVVPDLVLAWKFCSHCKWYSPVWYHCFSLAALCAVTSSEVSCLHPHSEMDCVFCDGSFTPSPPTSPFLSHNGGWNLIVEAATLSMYCNTWWVSKIFSLTTYTGDTICTVESGNSGQWTCPVHEHCTLHMSIACAVYTLFALCSGACTYSLNCTGQR